MMMVMQQRNGITNCKVVRGEQSGTCRDEAFEEWKLRQRTQLVVHTVGWLCVCEGAAE